MLRIYFGPMPEAIYNTAVFFKNSYRDDWIENDFAKAMIKAVDKSTVVSGRLIESKALGPIPPTSLSGGVKILLLIFNVPDKVFNASTCGDNCAKWILRIAKDRDVTINLHHVMDFGKGTFEIEILNDGSVVHSMRELVMVAGDYLGAFSEQGGV